MQRRKRGGAADDESQQNVGVAADVFGRRVHGHIDTEVECTEVQWGRPRVVHDDQRIAGMSNFGNGRDVLDIERQRPGRLDEYDPRVGTEFAGNVGTQQRVVVAYLDPQTLHVQFAKPAGRTVDRVGDQDVVARLRQRQQG